MVGNANYIVLFYAAMFSSMMPIVTGFSPSSPLRYVPTSRILHLCAKNDADDGNPSPEENSPDSGADAKLPLEGTSINGEATDASLPVEEHSAKGEATDANLPRAEQETTKNVMRHESVQMRAGRLVDDDSDCMLHASVLWDQEDELTATLKHTGKRACGQSCG